MALSFEQRRHEDNRAYGKLIHRLCEELEDIIFVAGLSLLIEAMKTLIHEGIVLTENLLDRMFEDFIRKTPGFLRKKTGYNAGLLFVVTTVLSFQGSAKLSKNYLFGIFCPNTPLGTSIML